MSNMIDGKERLSNTRNAFVAEYDWDYDDDYEIELTYERSLTRFVDLFAGVEFGQEEEEEKKKREGELIAGLHVVLPMLIEAELRLGHKSGPRLGFSSELQLTDRASFEWEWNTEKEWQIHLEYELNKTISLIANNDSDHGTGAGLMIKF